MKDDFDLDLVDLFPESDDELLGDETAYIKQEVFNFRPIFVVYDGLGQRLASAPTKQAAMMIAERADLVLRAVN